MINEKALENTMSHSFLKSIQKMIRYQHMRIISWDEFHAFLKRHTRV